MDLGELTARLALDSSQLGSGAADAVQSLSQVDQEMGQLEQHAGQLGPSLNNVGGRLAAIRQVSGVFRDLVGPMAEFSGELQESAGRADDLRDSLNGAFAGNADSVATFIESLGTAKGVLSDNQLQQAALTLQNLGAYSEDSLRRVADAAAATGKPINSLAEAFGRFQKFGNSESILELQKAIGASGKELQALGATLDGNGKLLLDTQQRVEAARQALQRFTSEKYGGALDRVSDDAAKLKGETELLKREMGQAGFALRDMAASAVLPLVQSMRQLPPEFKGVVGLSADLIGNFGGLAVSGVSLLAQLKTLGFSLQSVSSGLNAAKLAVLGLTPGIGGLILVLGSAAVGLAAYTKAIQDATQAQDDLNKVDLQTLKGFRDNRDVVGKSAAEIQKLGKGSKEVTLALRGLQDQYSNLQSAGRQDTPLAKGLQKQILELKAVRGELAQLEEKGPRKASQVFDQAAAQQPVTPGGVEKSQKEQQKAAEQAAKEAEREQKRRESEAEKARKAALDSELDGIKLQATAGQLSKQQQIQALRDVIASAKVNANERRQIEQQIATLEQQIRAESLREEQRHQAERTRQAAKAAAERVKAEKDAERAARGTATKDTQQEKAEQSQIQQLGKQKAEANKSAIQEQIRGLEGAIGKDAGALPAITKLIQDRSKITIQEIEAEREAILAGTNNEQVRQAAIETAEAKIRAEKAATTTAIEQETQKQNAALQSHADKHASVVAQIQQLQSQVGGSKSPIFTNPSEGLGIDLGNFSFGDLQKPESKVAAAAADVNVSATRSPDTGKAVADSVARGIKDGVKQALEIHLQVNVGGKSSEKNLAGDAADLSRELLTFNVDHQLGKI